LCQQATRIETLFSCEMWFPVKITTLINTVKITTCDIFIMYFTS